MFKNKALQNRCLYQIVRKNLVNDIAISSNRAVCILVSKNTKQPVKNDSFRPITFFNVLRAPEDTKSSHNVSEIYFQLSTLSTDRFVHFDLGNI